MSILLLISLIFGLIGAEAAASTCGDKSYFYESNPQGWYWKRLCPDMEEKKNEEDTPLSEGGNQHRLLKKEEVEIPWEILDRLDPDEINRLERESRKIAVMRPSEKNVREYMRYKNWLVDKAQRFTDTTKLLAKTDPELASRIAGIPTSAYAKEAQTRFKQDASEEIFRGSGQKTGLVVMVQEGCIYCKDQVPVIELFARTYGWDVQYIDIQQRPSLAQRLDVRPVPDLFIVLNRNDQALWQRIGIGLHTLDELKRSVLFGLYLLGEIKDESLIH